MSKSTIIFSRSLIIPEYPVYYEKRTSKDNGWGYEIKWYLYDKESKTFMPTGESEEAEHYNNISYHYFMPASLVTTVTVHGDVISLAVLGNMMRVINDKLVMVNTIRRLSMNVRTGRSYVCIKFNNKNLKFEDISYIHNGGSLNAMFTNISIDKTATRKKMDIHLSLGLYDSIYENNLEEECKVMYETYKEMKQSLFAFPLKFPVINKEKDDFFDENKFYLYTKSYNQIIIECVLHNRVPCADDRLMEALDRNRIRMTGVKGTSTSPMKDLLRVNKLPYNKTIVETVLNNHFAILFLKPLLKRFSLDNAIKIFTSMQLDYYMGENSCKTLIKGLMNFIAEQKNCSDKAIANKFAACTEKKDIRIATDAIWLYIDIKKHLPEYDGNIAGKTLREAHDIFSIDQRKLSTENQVIPYSKKEKELNSILVMNGNKYAFTLAEDTYKLIEVGGLMNICVGGYGRWAVEKSCTIVIMYKNNKLETCIELKDGKVNQSKAHRNGHVSEDVRQAIIQWALNNNIKPNCYDLEPYKEPVKRNRFAPVANEDPLIGEVVGAINAEVIEAIAEPVF